MSGLHARCTTAPVVVRSAGAPSPGRRGYAGGMFALLPLVLVAPFACAPQDVRDQRAARRRCGLPPDAAVLTWDGYPSQVGFGQREGLSVSGTFRPPPGWSSSAAGYRPAPWPRARDAAEETFRLGAWVDLAVALRCETAGDNVLGATPTTPCDARRPLNDLILCAVLPSGEVAVQVRSAY